MGVKIFYFLDLRFQFNALEKPQRQAAALQHYKKRRANNLSDEAINLLGLPDSNTRVSIRSTSRLCAV